jgi:ketosteroid isomerase-like protein
MNLVKRKEDIIKEYLNDYNRKDVDAMLTHFAEDVIFESVSNTNGVIRTMNKEELRKLAGISVDYFIERRQTVIGSVINDDKVAIEIDYWCKVAKDLPNGKKAGEEMTLRGASFFTIKDGLIKKLVDYM